MYENESLIKKMMNSKTKELFYHTGTQNIIALIKHLIILNCVRDCTMMKKILSFENV